MAIKVIKIEPANLGIAGDPIAAHKAVEWFVWVNESNQTSGKTSRKDMYNWIVNQKGQAYINVGGQTARLFGALSQTGEQYIQAAKDGKWVNDLLELSDKTAPSTPVGAV